MLTMKYFLVYLAHICHNSPHKSRHRSQHIWIHVVQVEPWTVCARELMIKASSPLLCFYSGHLCLVSLKQSYFGFWGFSHPQLGCSQLVRHTVRKWFLLLPLSVWSCVLLLFFLKWAQPFVLLWHQFVLTFLHSADCCGVAFKGQSDAPGSSPVISVAAVSTETGQRWAESSHVARRWRRRRPLTVTAAAPLSMTVTRYACVVLYCVCCVNKKCFSICFSS